MRALFLLATLAAGPAWAQEEIDVYGDFGDDIEEITVYGDLFARWDNTRWFIKTEVHLPYLMTMMADENLQFRTFAFQVRSILKCNKEWKLGRRYYEVDCEIEDFAIQATQWERTAEEQKQLREQRRKTVFGRGKILSKEELRGEKVEVPEYPSPAMPPIEDGRTFTLLDDLDVKHREVGAYPPDAKKLELVDRTCDVLVDLEPDGSISGLAAGGCDEALYERTESIASRWVFEAPGEKVRTQLAIDYRNDKANAVLAEIDAKLTGQKLQLQVKDDGQVVNIDLEGVSKRNRRMSEMQETLRMVMARTLVGFDMKLRRWNDLSEGQWVEYNPELMSMPTPDFITARGSSMLVHQLDKYQGHLVVQSVGRGAISYGDGNSENFFDANFNGVSIYDKKEGFMTERVWALYGRPTASSANNDGRAGLPYWHAGRIRILEPEQYQDVGLSRRVAPPANHLMGVPDWTPLEDVKDLDEDE